MIKIIRHAFALIREDKLFSAIYIAGTAVAIASAMVIAIFLNIKLADIPPESNRSRTLYPLFGFYTKSLAENGRSFDMRYSTAALDSCFRQLKCVESATGVTEAFLIVDDEVYAFGASLKDAGKRLFAYIKMHETSASDLIKSIR